MTIRTDIRVNNLVSKQDCRGGMADPLGSDSPLDYWNMPKGESWSQETECVSCLFIGTKHKRLSVGGLTSRSASLTKPIATCRHWGHV